MSGRGAVHDRLRQALRDRRPAEALTLARQELDEHGWDSQMGYLAGQAMFRLDDFAKAESLFRRVVADDPSHALAVYYTGLCRERQGDFEQARSLYRTALALRPDFPEARRKLGEDDGHSRRDVSDDGHSRRDVGADREGSLAAALDDRTGGVTAGQLLYSGRPRLRAFPGRLLGALALLTAAALAPRGARAVQQQWLGPWSQATNDDVLASALDGMADAMPTVGRVAVVVLGLIGVLWTVSLLLTWLGSRYDIHERRIDLRAAGFRTNYDSIWLYEIVDVRLAVPPLLALAGSSRLYIRTATQPAQERPAAVGMRPTDTVHAVPGLGGRSFMKQLWRELRDAALVERRAMHRWWV